MPTPKPALPEPAPIDLLWTLLKQPYTPAALVELLLDRVEARP